MTTPYVSDAAVFLIKTAFGIYIIALMLRFLLAWHRADFYNPFSQFLVTITNPLLRPTRRIVPGLRGIDVASLALLLLLQMLEVWLVVTVSGYGATAPGLIVVALAELLAQLLNIYLFSVFVLVVLSWVAPQSYSPIVGILRSLTRPVMAPAQRMLPPIAGVDLSPIVVLVAIQLGAMLIVAPLRDLGYGLMQ